MVSINKSTQDLARSEAGNQNTTRNGKQGPSWSHLGIAALAATSCLVSTASASLTPFSDLASAGKFKTRGGVKKLPLALQPGHANRALLGNLNPVVTAPPALPGHSHTWYGLSASLTGLSQHKVALPAYQGRRLPGLTPFGGGGTPAPTGGTTPPVPTTPSCSTPNPPQPAPSAPIQGSGSSLTSAQLRGCPMSDYSAPVNVGGQASTAIADTGSSTFAIASSKCTNCDVSPEYKPGSSSKDDGIKIEGDYGKGAWLGELTTDSVSFAGGPSVNMKFAAIFNQSAFFDGNGCDLTAQKPGPSINQAIMGLGQPDLVVNGTDSWIERTNSTLAAPVITFALCDQNGAVFLGGYPKNGTASDLVLTPTVPPKDSPYVAVALEALSVGNTDIGATLNDFGYAIVDTGSTGLYFPSDVYQAIAQGISQGTNGAITQDFFDQGECAQLSSTTVSDLNSQAPSLTFSFLNAANTSTVNTVETPASISYLLAQDDGNGGLIVCPAMIDAGSESPMTLLGNTMMRGFLTIFDYGGNQVGWAVSQNICKTS